MLNCSPNDSELLTVDEETILWPAVWKKKSTKTELQTAFTDNTTCLTSQSLRQWQDKAME